MQLMRVWSSFQFKVCGLGEMAKWSRILLLQRNQVQWSLLVESPYAGSFVQAVVALLACFLRALSCLQAL